jgi:hypothetical protein
MRRFFSAIILFLMSGSALAQKALDEGPNIPLSETVDVFYVGLFGVIFIGMIAYFFWYLWRHDEKQDLEGKGPKEVK